MGRGDDPGDEHGRDRKGELLPEPDGRLDEAADEPGDTDGEGCQADSGGKVQGGAGGVTLGSSALVAAAEAVLRTSSRGAAPDPWAPLTAREYEVAVLIADSRTNQDIADQLGIARKTVTAHVELHSRPHGDDREQ